MSGITIPEVHPDQQDEQGRPITRPQPNTWRTTAESGAVSSPLNLDNMGSIIEESGLGAQKHLSKSQFPEMPKPPGEPGLPGEGAPAAEGAGAAEGAAGLGALAELPIIPV